MPGLQDLLRNPRRLRQFAETPGNYGAALEYASQGGVGRRPASRSYSTKKAEEPNTLETGDVIEQVALPDGSLVKPATESGKLVKVPGKSNLYLDPATGEPYQPDPTKPTGIRSAYETARQVKRDGKVYASISGVGERELGPDPKVAEDAAKENRRLALDREKRPYQVNRITGEPIPRQTDEEWAAIKQAKAAKLDEAARVKRLKDQADVIDLEADRINLTAPKPAKEDEEAFTAAESALSQFAAGQDIDKAAAKFAGAPATDEASQQAKAAAENYLAYKDKVKPAKEAEKKVQELKLRALDIKEQIINPQKWKEGKTASLAALPDDDLVAEVQAQADIINEQEEQAVGTLDFITKGRNKIVNEINAFQAERQVQATMGLSADEIAALDSRQAELEQALADYDEHNGEAKAESDAALKAAADRRDVLAVAGTELEGRAAKQAEAASQAQAKAETMAKAKPLYEGWAKGLYSDDWRTEEETPRLAQEAAKAGLDVASAKEALQTYRQLDWSNTRRDPQTAKPIAEESRTLPDGNVTVNPTMWGDATAYQKAVEASQGTPEGKAKALEAFPKLQELHAEKAVEILSQSANIPGADNFMAWRERKIEEDQAQQGKLGFARQSPARQAIAYMDEMKNRSWFRKAGEQVAMGLLAGFQDIATQAVGAMGMMTSSEALSQLSADMAGNTASMYSAQQLEGSDTDVALKIIGTTARIGPAVAASMAAAGALGAGFTTAVILAGSQTAGSMFADLYRTFRNEKGMNHSEAWKMAALPSALAGAATSLLTAGFGKTGWERVYTNTQAQQSLNNAYRTYLSQFAKGAVEELPEELPDEFISQALEGMATGKDPRQFIEEYVKGVPELAGATAIMGGAGGMIQARQNAQASPGGMAPPPEGEAPAMPVQPRPAGPAPTPAPETPQDVTEQIAKFNPTGATPLPQSVAATAKRTGRPPAAVARQAASAVVKIAQGQSLESLDSDELEALGFVNKDGKIVADSKVTPLVYDYKGKPVIRNAAAEWLTDEAQEGLAGMVNLTEAERKAQIDAEEAKANAKPAKKKAGQAKATKTESTPQGGPTAKTPDSLSGDESSTLSPATTPTPEPAPANEPETVQLPTEQPQGQVPEVMPVVPEQPPAPAQEAPPEPAPAAGKPKHAISKGAVIFSDVYRSEGDVTLTGDPFWDADQKEWLYPALTKGGRRFRVAERFVSKVVSTPAAEAPPAASQPAEPALTPTQADQMARAQAEYDSAIRLAKADPDPQIRESRKMAAGMKFSAAKRIITGKLTAKEAEAKAKREASNYEGKAVSVDGKNAEVIGNAFGKVKVKFADGTKAAVPAEKVKPPVEAGSEAKPAALDHPAIKPHMQPKHQARVQALEAQGVQVVTVETEEDAAKVLGVPLKRKGNRGVTAMVNGKPVVIFIAKNFAGKKDGGAVITEELHHAAALVVLQQNPELLNEALAEVGGLNGGTAIYSKWDSLTPLGKLIEAAAAYASGKWNPDASSPVKRLVDAIMDAISKAFGLDSAQAKTATAKAIRSLADSADALLDSQPTKKEAAPQEPAQASQKEASQPAPAAKPPEQMTPMTVNVIGGGTVEVQVPQKWDAELGQYVLSPEAEAILNEAKWPKSFSSPFHLDYATRDMDSYFGTWGVQGDEQNRTQTRKNYRELLELAVRARKPVSREGWTMDLRNPFPTGYVREGDLYVYRPEASPAPASQEAGQAEAKADLAKLKRTLEMVQSDIGAHEDSRLMKGVSDEILQKEVARLEEEIAKIEVTIKPAAKTQAAPSTWKKTHTVKKGGGKLPTGTAVEFIQDSVEKASGFKTAIVRDAKGREFQIDPNDITPAAEQAPPPRPATPEGRAEAASQDEALKVIDAAIRRYDERSRPYEGGQGLAVGAENANDRIAADALMSMKRAVRKGKDVDEALKIAIADAHEMVRNHNRKRPKDINWQRWEGTADSILTMTAAQAKRATAGRAQAEPVPESQTPPPQKPATEPETAGQSSAQAVKEVAPPPRPATPEGRAEAAIKEYVTKVTKEKAAAKNDAAKNLAGRKLDLAVRLMKRLKAMDGVVNYDVGDFKGELQAKPGLIVVNPVNTINRLAEGFADKKKGQEQLDAWILHEFIHLGALAKLDDAKIISLYEALTPEAKEASRKLYYKGKDTRFPDTYAAAHEWFAQQVEAILRGEVSNSNDIEGITNPTLRDSLVALLRDFVAQLRDIAATLQGKNPAMAAEIRAQAEAVGKIASDMAAKAGLEIQPKPDDKAAFYISEIRPTNRGQSIFEVGVDKDGDGRSERDLRRNFRTLAEAVAYGESHNIRNATPKPWALIGNTHVTRKDDANITVQGEPGAYEVVDGAHTRKFPTLRGVREYLDTHIFEGSDAYAEQIAALQADDTAEMRAEYEAADIFTLKAEAKKAGIELDKKATKAQVIEALLGQTAQAKAGLELGRAGQAADLAARVAAVEGPSQAQAAKRDAIDEELAKAFEGLANPPASDLTALDREYLAAVEAEDMAKAQRMVDEAAKRAGYGQNQYSKDDFDTWAKTIGELDQIERIAINNSISAEQALKNTNISPVLRKVAQSSLERNKKKAQEIQDKKQKGPPPKRLVRGDSRADITVYRGVGGRSIWATDSEQVAKTYGDNVRSFFLEMKNPLVVDADGRSFKELSFEDSKLDADDLSDIAKERGYDGLIIRNFYDSNTDDGGDVIADHFTIFNPSQIKSADPVTYDDAGNVIPLSQRFNPASDSILYNPPTSQPVEQIALPKDRREAMLKAAGNIVDLGLTEPADLVARLDKLAPGGALRKYARSFWRLMTGFNADLAESPDWQAVFAAVDSPASSGDAPAKAGLQVKAEEPAPPPPAQPEARQEAQAARKAPPSLGETGKAIWQGWKNMTGVNVMPGESVVGVDVHNGGVFFWSGNELMRSTTNAKQGYALMRPATKAEIEGLHDSIDRGGLQVESRINTGATGMFPKVESGKTTRVFHQATGKPLPEFLQTAAGKAWAKREEETQQIINKLHENNQTQAQAEPSPAPAAEAGTDDTPIVQDALTRHFGTKVSVEKLRPGVFKVGRIIYGLYNVNKLNEKQTINGVPVGNEQVLLKMEEPQAEPSPAPAAEAGPEAYASPLAQFVGEWLGMNASQQARVDMPQRVIRLAVNQADTEAVMALVKEASVKGADGEPLFNTPHQRLYVELREMLRFMQRKGTGAEKGAVSTQLTATTPPEAQPTPAQPQPEPAPPAVPEVARQADSPAGAEVSILKKEVDDASGEINYHVGVPKDVAYALGLAGAWSQLDENGYFILRSGYARNPKQALDALLWRLKDARSKVLMPTMDAHQEYVAKMEAIEAPVRTQLGELFRPLIKEPLNKELSARDAKGEPAIWLDEQIITPEGKYHFDSNGKLRKDQDLSKTGFEKNLDTVMSADGEGVLWGANRAAKAEIKRIQDERAAKKAAEDQAAKEKAEKEAQEQADKVAYAEAVEAVVLPKGKKQSIGIKDATGAVRQEESTVVGSLAYRKNPTKGKDESPYLITHVPTGLSITGRSVLSSLSDVTRFLKGMTLSGVDLSKPAFEESERAKMLEAIVAFRGGAVPNWFKAPRPAPPVTAEPSLAKQTREEVAEAARAIAGQDPSIPPPPPDDVETLQALRDRANRKGYKPDKLTPARLAVGIRAGWVTKTKEAKLTEKGYSQLAEWEQQQSAHDRALGALSDKLVDEAVSKWDRENDPTSWEAMNTARQPSPAAQAPAEKTQATEQDPITAARNVIKEALDQDDAKTAIDSLAKLDKSALEKVLASYVPTGNAKTAKELRIRFSEAAERLTKTAILKATKRNAILAAANALKKAQEKQQSHLSGFIGIPTGEASSGIPITEAQAHDPHGIGREVAIRMWQAEVDAAKAKLDALQGQPAEAPEAGQPAPAPAEGGQGAKPAKAEAGIADFGEKILGARKDLWGKYKRIIEQDLPDSMEDVTLARNVPEPDYEAAIANGVPVEALAVLKAIRDVIPPKPKRSYKLKNWGEAVRFLHKLTQDTLASKSLDPSLLTALEKTSRISGLAGKIALYQHLGYPLFTKAKPWTIANWDVSYFKGQKLNNFTPATIATKDDRSTDFLVLRTGKDAFSEVADMIKRHLQKETDTPVSDKPKAKEIPFNIYGDRFTNDHFIGRKGINGVVRLKAGFADEKAARQYLADNRQTLEKQWEGMKIKPDYRRTVNQPRQGPERRDGDVTPEMFQSTFGFRGVQFGNWVEGDRRQTDLNQAFDALIDLAEILGVPPKAMSLDGSLGLAFGARGTAGAKAHYEPGEVVINLTKETGPGSLAHEWFHAFDNYFARLDATGETKARSLDKFATSNKKPAQEKMRPAVWEAFKRIRTVLDKGTFAERSKSLDDARSKPYYSTLVEKAARAFEQYTVDRLAGKEIANDYLVNLVKDESPALPTQAEMDNDGIRAAYDNLFNILDAVETETGVRLQNPPADEAQPSLANPPNQNLSENTQEINELLKTIPRRSPDDEKWSQDHSQSLLRWASENGKIFSEQRFNDTFGQFSTSLGGAEHVVAKGPDGRALKMTVADSSMGWGHQHTLDRYLYNIVRSNIEFGDDIKLEGIFIKNGWPHIVTSQPWVEGRSATQDEIDKYMKQKGFTKREGPRAGEYVTKDGILLADALPKNVLVDKQGNVRPIDVIFRVSRRNAVPYNLPSRPGLANPPAAEEAAEPGQTDADMEAFIAEQQAIAEAEEAARQALLNKPENIEAMAKSGKMDVRNKSLIFKNPAARRFYQAIQAATTELGMGYKMNNEELRAWARKQFDLDPEGSYEWALENAYDNAPLRVEEQALLFEVMDRMFAENSPFIDRPSLANDKTALATYIDATRSDEGRRLQFGVDTVETPQQRWNRAIEHITGPDRKQRNKWAIAPSASSKAKRIADLEERLATAQDREKRDIEAALKEAEKIKTREDVLEEITRENKKILDGILAKMGGVTRDDITHTPTERVALQSAILDLKAVKDGLDKYRGKDNDGYNIMRLAFRGFSDAHIANYLNLNQDDVSQFIRDAINAIIRPAVAEQVKAGTGFGGFIKAGFAKVKKAIGLSNPPKTIEDQPALIKGTRQTIDDVTAEVNRVMAYALPSAKARNSGKLMSKVVMTPEGQKVRVFVPFDPDDMANYYAFAREYTAAKASAFDKVYEYWINWPLLSGPQTQVANITGNAAQVAWHYTGQRFTEAFFNLVYQDPNAPQYREFKHIIKGFWQGIGPALDMARQTFLTEGDTIRHKYLGEDMQIDMIDGDLDKVGNIRASVGGQAGRISRLPGRVLRFTDAFFKTAIMYAEASAVAYRRAHVEAKRQGLKGQARAAFIDTEIANTLNDTSSAVWGDVMKTAEELLFQDENMATEIVDTALGGYKGIRDLEKLLAEAEAKGDSELAAKLQKRIRSRKFVGSLMRWIFPFQRTPTNIVRAGIKKAGGSAISLLYGLTMAGWRKHKDGTDFIKSYPKAMQIKDASETLLAYLGWLALASMLEGDDNDDEKPVLLVGTRSHSLKERAATDQFLRKYGGENSIVWQDGKGKVLGSLPFGRYEPAATLLTTWIDAYRNYQEVKRLKSQGENANYSTYMLSSLVSSLEDKSFLQGFANAMQFIRDVEEKRENPDENAGIKMLMNNIIPNIIKQPLRNMDDVLRERTTAGPGYAALPNPTVAPKLPVFAAQPKISTTGERLPKAFTPPARLLFQANTKVTPQPDALLYRANQLHPRKRWNPQPLNRDDYTANPPGKAKPVPITDPAKRRQFAELAGRLYATKAAQVAARAMPSEKAQPGESLIKAFKKAREDAMAAARKQAHAMGLHKVTATP